MPSVINQSETGVPDGERPDLTAEEISRSVDLIIVRLRSQQYKFREIGQILNRPIKTVENRYYRTPEPVREHYASVSLG